MFLVALSLPSFAGEVKSLRPTQAKPPAMGKPDRTPFTDSADYMKEFQYKIVMNWSPPIGEQGKRIVVMVSTDNQGNVISVKMIQPCDSKAANAAAVKAVKSASPFRPLMMSERLWPQDIQFTFDANVFNYQEKLRAGKSE
jgi:TonB family protein